MSSPDLPSSRRPGALRRVVRLAARALGTDGAQFIPSGSDAEVVAYGTPAELRGLGFDTLVGDERGLVVSDTAGTPPFSRLAPAVQFVAAVPVAGTHRQRLGVLCLIDGSSRAFGVAEQQTLAEFGCLVAEVVEGDRGAAPAAHSAGRPLFEGHGALMLLVDPYSGVIVEANAAAAAFYGVAVEDLAGRPLAALTVLSEDRVLPALQRTLRESRSLLRLQHRAASGEMLTVELMVSTVVIGGRLLLYAVGRDVTDQLRVAESLRRRERTLHGFYDEAPVMMGVVELVGEDLLSVSSNEAAAQFYGTTVEAMEGCTASELGVPEAIGERWLEAYRQSALSGGAVRFEYDHPHPRGHRRLAVVVRCVGLSAEGAPQFSYIAEDVTERTEAEVSLRAAQERAEAAARRSSGLLASIGHEIRTPLTALVGFSEALDAVVAPEHRDVSGLIVRSGHQLLSTIDSVLDLARLETSPVELAPVDVAAEVEAAAQLLRPLAERKGLRLDVRVADTPAMPADAVLLVRIVHNLVGNALLFTEEGGVTVEVEAEDAGVVLRVHDTGESVNDAFLPRRTDAFRDDAEPEEEGGLAITRRLVDLLGGTLDVASRRGEGTTFTVRLPRPATEAEQPTAPGEVAHES